MIVGTLLYIVLILSSYVAAGLATVCVTLHINYGIDALLTAGDGPRLISTNNMSSKNLLIKFVLTIILSLSRSLLLQKKVNHPHAISPSIDAS